VASVVLVDAVAAVEVDAPASSPAGRAQFSCGASPRGSGVIRGVQARPHTRCGLPGSGAAPPSSSSCPHRRNDRNPPCRSYRRAHRGARPPCRSGRPAGKAVHYLRRAGLKAAARSALPEARASFGHSYAAPKREDSGCRSELAVEGEPGTHPSFRTRDPRTRDPSYSRETPADM
jgi:hypothetical protein